jgi:hypothetical protein
MKHKIISADLVMKESADLKKAIAADLQISDPTGIIPAERIFVNENTQKYDRGTSGSDYLQDRIEAGE